MHTLFNDPPSGLHQNYLHLGLTSEGISNNLHLKHYVMVKHTSLMLMLTVKRQKMCCSIGTSLGKLKIGKIKKILYSDKIFIHFNLLITLSVWRRFLSTSTNYAWQALLKLKTWPRFHPVCLSLSIAQH